MREDDADLFGLFQSNDKGPDVFLHVRARVDDHGILPTDQIRSASVQRKRTPIPGLENPGLYRRNSR